MSLQLTAEQQKGMEFMNSIVEKATEDNSFKQSLISNPVSAIEDFKGGSLDLSGGLEIVAMDQSDPDVIYINIPSPVAVSDMELTDQQLELVSGGWGWVPKVIKTAYYGYKIYKTWRG